jgi:hypothetical protein
MRRRLALLSYALLVSLAAGLFASPAAGEAPRRSGDEQMLAIGREVAGFGGLFRDRTGRHVAWVQDPSSAGADTLRAALGDVQILRGDFAFERLVAWRGALRPLLALADVRAIDADESRNRVVLGIGPAVDVAALRAAIAASGVPADAVVLSSWPEMAALPLRVEAPAKPRKGPTVRDRFRPVPGGVQIAFGNFVCTLGFNAVRQGVTGFVTNSHCSAVQGAADGTRYAQPTGRTFIATESFDPPRFEGGACPPGRVCRFSDSAFVRWGNRRDANLARIARPSGLNSVKLAAAAHRFVINAVAEAAVGDVVNKVGRTTGWTRGPVVATCADVNVAGSNSTMLCQSVVEGISNSGDSGSPVFIQSSATNASLVGILWGGNAAAGIFVFSPGANVGLDLGTLALN